MVRRLKRKEKKKNPLHCSSMCDSHIGSCTLLFLLHTAALPAALHMLSFVQQEIFPEPPSILFFLFRYISRYTAAVAAKTWPPVSLEDTAPVLFFFLL